MQHSEQLRTQVLVKHAEPLVAAGLVYSLREDSDIEVFRDDEWTGEASDATVDVIVADYRSGMELAQHANFGAHGRLAVAKILLVSRQDREHEVRAALQAGVYGYVPADCRVNELVTAVRALARGKRYMSSVLVGQIADGMLQPALTSREIEVLRLVASGRCNKTIARELEIATGTVKTHVSAIISKLGAACRTEAVAIATRRGMVKDDSAWNETPPLAPAESVHRAHAAAPC